MHRKNTKSQRAINFDKTTKIPQRNSRCNTKFAPRLRIWRKSQKNHREIQDATDTGEKKNTIYTTATQKLGSNNKKNQKIYTALRRREKHSLHTETNPYLREQTSHKEPPRRNGLALKRHLRRTESTPQWLQE